MLQFNDKIIQFMYVIYVQIWQSISYTKKESCATNIANMSTYTKNIIMKKNCKYTNQPPHPLQICNIKDMEKLVEFTFKTKKIFFPQKIP
jgi:hypothetical protein